jgi:hypothetical protein
MCHDFIAIVLQSSASSVLIVCAPRSARLLKVFSRSSLRNFVKYARGRQVLKHPSVTVCLRSFTGANARSIVISTVAAAPFALWLLRAMHLPPQGMRHDVTRFPKRSLSRNTAKQAMRSIASVKPVVLICLTSSALALMRPLLTNTCPN